MAEKNTRKWYHHQLSEDELKVFVDKSLAGKENKKAFVGVLNPLTNRGGATLRCCLSAPPAYGISVFALFPLPRVRPLVFRI
jgi:hypothetical protein